MGRAIRAATKRYSAADGGGSGGIASDFCAFVHGLRDGHRCFIDLYWCSPGTNRRRSCPMVTGNPFIYFCGGGFYRVERSRGSKRRGNDQLYSTTAFRRETSL